MIYFVSYFIYDIQVIYTICLYLWLQTASYYTARKAASRHCWVKTCPAVKTSQCWWCL